MLELHKRLKELRKSKNIPHQELAALLGVSPRTYRHYETGDREPKIKALIILADYFGVTIDYLVGRCDH